MQVVSVLFRHCFEWNHPRFVRQVSTWSQPDVASDAVPFTCCASSTSDAVRLWRIVYCCGPFLFPFRVHVWLGYVRTKPQNDSQPSLTSIDQSTSYSEASRWSGVSCLLQCSDHTMNRSLRVLSPIKWLCRGKTVRLSARDQFVTS